jgi:hypothetical protein
MNDADFPRLNMDDPQVEVARIEPPPHNGFGSEEDSLASFLYLMPKVPKADFKKLIELDGVNLRFLAKFKPGGSGSHHVPGSSLAKVDANRRFIVTYYLANDTFQVFEKFERNSGFVGGKFLERDRFKNPLTGEWYRASDFYVGGDFTVNKFQFHIEDADEYTKKFMLNNEHIWGRERLAPIRQAAQQQQQAGKEGNAFANESTQQIRETNATNQRQVEQQAADLAAGRPVSAKPQ